MRRKSGDMALLLIASDCSHRSNATCQNEPHSRRRPKRIILTNASYTAVSQPLVGTESKRLSKNASSGSPETGFTSSLTNVSKSKMANLWSIMYVRSPISQIALAVLSATRNQVDVSFGCYLELQETSSVRYDELWLQS